MSSRSSKSTTSGAFLKTFEALDESTGIAKYKFFGTGEQRLSEPEILQSGVWYVSL